jgi:two-component system chemotaxis sensor kinase CheA
MSRISILASEKNNLLHIEVVDDGHGIDYRHIREKAILKGLAKENDEHQEAEYWLNFLFLYGLSAGNANRATGLDIVRNQLSGIGGSINIHSKPDTGTRFVMRMPVTVAIQSAILVLASAQTFAIPSRYLVEIIEVPHDNLQTIQNQVAVNLRGNMLPVYHLETLLALEKTRQNGEISSTLMLLILQNDNHCIALAIDNVMGKQEFFLRDVHPDLRNIPGIGGISLLGNGNAVIILDCENLFALAKNHA